MLEAVQRNEWWTWGVRWKKQCWRRQDLLGVEDVVNNVTLLSETEE